MRKLCCLLLIVPLLICLYSSNALASPHIDLSRVKFSSGSEPLVFKFGDISLDGRVHQIFPFTEQEINKLVKETLKSMNTTELEIMEANKKVERAKRASEFTQEDLQRVKDNFIKSMKVVPPAGKAADILKIIDDYMDSSSWDDIGTASVDLLEGQVTDWVKNTAGGFVDKAGELAKNAKKGKEWAGKLTLITSFCEMLADEHARTKQKWKDIADGANAKRFLNEFYYALQRKIDSYKSKSDRAGWVIDFHYAMGGRNFTFFGVDSNYQTWYMDMRLEQTQKDELGSAVGHYKGYFVINAKHEMSNFLSRAHEAIRHMEGFDTAIKSIESKPGYTLTLTTSSKGQAYIGRTISGTCEATIEESGNIIFSMNEENDDTIVEISGISVNMSYSAVNSPGLKGIGDIQFNFSAQEENIIVDSATGKIGAIMPKGGFSHALSASGSHSVGWDNTIWKAWDGTEKKLEHASR